MGEDRLKFRIWDKINNSYWDNAMMYADGVIQDTFNNKHRQSLQKDEIITEQCTSLKDKNETLIYEGDIVRLYRVCMFGTAEERKEINKKIIGEFPIIYNKEELCFCIDDTSMGTYSGWDCLEIIGNIHEETNND
jgi:uncharacterized phage protein (TIGR01671 family)